MNTLTVPKNLEGIYNKWTYRTIQKLIDGGLFEVKYEDFPEFNVREVVGKRHSFIGFVKLNNVLIGIDVWDGPHPTSDIAEYLMDSDFYSKTKIIFKIQYRPNHQVSSLKTFKEKTGIILSNWTMFHGAVFPLSYFKWDNNESHKYLTYISGKRRDNWINVYRDSKEIATFDNSGYTKVKKNRPKVTNEDYLKVVRECKWGLSLMGKRVGHMDCKNRREVEFSSCGMPLILNYTPEYPFPFEKNKHYVYINKPEDLINIRDIDPIPYHEASIETYDKYFSDKGSSQVFLDLVEKLIK